MDRNREARRANNNNNNTMAAPPNGLSSARRRHRSSSLRDSPDEDGGMEVQEASRLRDRGVIKKDRDRDRERERDRERSRSKRRRENRMMSHHDGDDSSSESVNDEEDDEDDAGNGGGLRMLPPPPSASNHHSHNINNINNSSNSYSQHLHRKSFPSSGGNSNNNKVFRGSGSPAAVPAVAHPPAWKAADEMIGVSVPRKARSASTKRSHEWTSGVIGGTGTGTGSGTESIHRQSSTSPAPEPPLSPSSSNVSVRKKMKANGSSKPRPPKSLSKSSSSNPEELEIEIAEVLYGLMTQSQAPSKKDNNPLNDSTATANAKFESNKSSSDTKSTSLSTVAPKRKRPRQVSENPFSVRSSPVSSSMKAETDHYQHHQSPKTDISSPYLENSSPASAVAAENGTSFGFTTLPSSEPQPPPPLAAEAGEEAKFGVGVVLTKEAAEKDSPAVGLNDGNNNNNNIETVITTAASTKTTDLKVAAIQETVNKKEEKFEIDLMAPPPQQRTSDGDIEFSNQKQNLPEPSKTKEEQKLIIGKEETLLSKTGSVQETGESSKQAMNEERKLDLSLDFEKPNKDSGNSNRSLHQALKHQQLSTKSETHPEKTAQPSSLPIPMPVANWPPMGYVAPLQGVISMDGSAMSSAPVQPLFTHPRPKRCATHCYIARNINYLQQLMKINPFWPPASASAAPMFGSKPSTELQSHMPQSMQDKSQQVGIFPGQTTVKDTKSSQTTSVPDPTLRKQQVLLQQAMPPGTPNNILHGPAFIFPFNQQQAAVAAASVRPGTSKLDTSTATGVSASANTATVSSSTTPAAVPALSFNYPNMSANDTQYLAIVQNHPYAFPMPAAVGAPPNYRGNHPHPQAMPLFNGSFYSSQMIHPSQIPQPPHPAPPPTQAQQTHQNSSGSTSSSQKHLQAQQRQQGSGVVAVGGNANGSGGGSHNSYPAAHKSRSPQMNPPAQARHLENEVTGGEDSPSTADSRVSRAATNTIGVYGHNLALPVHTQNFALMTPQSASASSADKKTQQVLKRVGAESSPLQPPQTFAMSFAQMNGAQNHAMFQSLPESVRQGYHQMMASSAVSASAHHSEPKKDFRITEEASRTGHESSNPDDDRKLPAKSGQSIAFSRPDLVTDTSGSSAAISSNSLNLGSNSRSTRSPISTSAAQSSHHFHAQFQQQQVLQLQKHHQQSQNQNMNARSKTLNPNQPPSSNGTGSPYPDHLMTSSSSMAGKFPNSLSSFPIQTSTTNSSTVQSPQWRNSVRGPTTSSTTTSSLKSLHQTQQQQPSRSQVSHTQISFGASQKLQPTPSTQMQQQHQQQQNQNPSSNNSASPPMLVGSPTSSSLSSQPPKNTQISSPSILGNPHNSNVNKTQQQQQQQHQLHKQLQHQQQQQQRAYAQMMFTHPNMQVQQPPGQQHSVGSTQASGYYLPRKQQQQSVSSTAMLSLSPSVTLASTTTSDPAKAIAAATSNLKGGVGLVSQQGVLHAAQYGGGAVAAAAAAAAQSSMPAGFPYVHNAPPPAAVQVKPAEQKQPAA
ncbi:protein TIME FOR COFFEE-like isoform X2 [Bidens hawaiensis]|uniref:protein TIME FOR COFFEE-like isoform X2 n=1 Tax=Bidens hawaiensis TaxID=980011 RepID=UPI004049F411